MLEEKWAIEGLRGSPSIEFRVCGLGLTNQNRYFGSL